MTLDLTVFLASVGESTTEEVRRRCLETQQRLNFKYDEIIDVTPLPNALQMMLDRCETAWFIAQDADVFLDHGAIERLHVAMILAPDNVCIVCGWLWDDVAGRPIIGVRCYRTTIAKQFPFRDTPGSDSDQAARMYAAGYVPICWPDEAKTRAECVGEHIHDVPSRTFRHWRELVMKQRQVGKRDWIYDVVPRLRSRAIETKNVIHEAAWYGALVGIFMPLDNFKENDGSKLTGWEDIEKYAYRRL